jgi:hypothetical protein
MQKINKICKCGKEFESYISQERKYCSKSCGAKYAIKMKKKQIIEKECKCGKLFKSYISQKRLYCSMSCRSKYRLRIKNKLLYKTTICKNCNSVFSDLKCRTRKFCSISCKSHYQSRIIRGKNHPNYNPNKSNVHYPSTIECAEWREEVFIRDNYTCQACGKTKCYIEPHHIKSKQVHPELVYKIDNGITLCKTCHRMIHKLVPSNQVIKISEYPISILLAPNILKDKKIYCET